MKSVSLKNRYLLILDDDPLVSPILEQALEVESVCFSRTKEILAFEADVDPLAIFVDLHLTESESGLDVIPQLRNRFASTPILVITSSQTEESLSESLATGADDFIRKPLSLKEVTARLQRRLGDADQRVAADSVKFGDVVLHREHRQLRGAGKRAELSPLGQRILQALIEAKGTVVSREKLKKLAWNGRAVTDNALDRKVYEVRQALKETSRCLQITTLYGSGFVLEVKPSKSEVA